MPDLEINNFDQNKFKNTLTNAPVLGKIQLGVGRRRIFDATNRVIGTCAGNKIYDLNGKLWGTIITHDTEAGFNKNDIVDRGTVIATIDSRNNIYRKQLSVFKADTSTNVYLGTIRGNKVAKILLPLLISILAITGVSGVVLSGILKSNNDPDYLKYAPVIGVYSGSVYPDRHWDQIEELNIFEKENYGGIIAPGYSGKYQFVVKNENTHEIEYRITMEKDDEHDYHLKYRLRRGEAASGKGYVSGNGTIAGYLEPEQVVPSKVKLAPGATHVYILEWMWVDDGTEEQDAIDTHIGEHSAPDPITKKTNPDYTYKLTLTVSAEYVG